MFRKIVSNINFSPALVGQLGFYAKRLRKEEATRRLGLIFTALALVVQSFAVFTPPEAANAASPGKVGSSPRCEVQAVGARGSAFDVDGNGKAKVTFDVSGPKNCKVQISANSFFAPSMNGRPYNQQKLHDRNTKVYDTNGRYTLSTQLPPSSDETRGCFYQVDLTYGTNNITPVLAYGHGKLRCNQDFQKITVCVSVAVSKISETNFTIKGQADGDNIRAYSYVIRNAAGKIIHNKEIASRSNSTQFNFAHDTKGSYSVQLIVKTSESSVTSPGCKTNFDVSPPEVKTPIATCGDVSASVTNRTRVTLSGTSQSAGGATIKSYTFIVKDSTGKEVKRVVVANTTAGVTTEAFELSESGKYTVQLVVQTSLGDKTAGSCETGFTVSPPDVCQYNPELSPNSPDCQPCPGNPDIWVKDDNCKAEVVSTKSAVNLSRGEIDATTTLARAGDKISYTLTANNVGLLPEKVSFTEELPDVLEYATIIDAGGGTYDAGRKSITWPEVTIEPGKQESRTIVVQTLNPIPITNTGADNTASYDCVMTNEFGNTTIVNVECPVAKQIVEATVAELPRTGARENMIFAGVLLAVVVYFYARSRQLGKEVRLVRRGLNAGTI